MNGQHFQVTYICHSRCICKTLRHPCAIEGVGLDDDWASTTLDIVDMGMVVGQHVLLNGEPICLEWKNFGRSVRIGRVDLNTREKDKNLKQIEFEFWR